MGNKVGGWMMVFFIGAYLVAQGALGRFLTYDEVEYKSPGREWAATGRFAAPELHGFWGVFGIEGVQDPSEAWFLNSPLYPVLFGVYVRMMGFGWRQSVLFDALIRSGLAIACYAVSRRLAPELPSWCSSLVGAIVLMFGVTGRPEDLTLLFGMLCFLVILSYGGWKGSAVAGVLLGLSATSSFVGAGLLGLMAFPVVVRSSHTLGEIFRRAITLGAFSACPVLAVFGSVMLRAPRSFEQLLALSRWNLQSSVVQDLSGVARTVIEWNWVYVMLCVSGLILAVAFPVELPRSEEARLSWLHTLVLRVPLWLGPMSALIVIVLKFPTKAFYYWFPIPWLSIIAMVGMVRWFSSARIASSLAVLSFASVVLTLAAIPSVKDALILLTLKPEQRIEPNDRLARRIIPPGSRVIVHHLWSSLAGERTVYDPIFSRPDFSKVDYIVQHGNGSGFAGQPVPISGMPDRGFVVIHDNLNREPLRILGLHVTNSAYGFGSRILKRSDTPVEAKPY